MNQDDDHNYLRVKKSVVLVAVLILAAGLVGWQLGRKGISSNAPTGSSSNPQSTTTDTNTPGVKSLVSYQLPDGWKEAGCESSPGSVYIVPNGSAGVDCGANPSSPVKISVDPGSSKDCNELQNVQQVKKHICISLYINNNKTLKASTEYLTSSSYGTATTVDAYYVDTGKGVVKLESFYSAENRYQTGFEQLANSVRGK